MCLEVCGVCIVTIVLLISVLCVCSAQFSCVRMYVCCVCAWLCV